MDFELLPRDDAGNRRTHRQRALEMVGEVPEIRRAERTGRSLDLFHFLISLAQVLGMSADDVFAAYTKKNEVNFKRQDSGYTKKDEDDSKHI